MQHFFKVEGQNEESARTRLADELGLPPYELKFIENTRNQFKFEAITCNPLIETEISRDKMKAYIKRIKLPIGNEAPKLTTDYVINLLKKRGVKYGIQVEKLTEVLFKITSDPNFNEAKPLNILAAMGKDSVPAQAGRPQWVLDLKAFKKGKPVYAKKGDVIAKAEISVAGQKGYTVLGEEIDFRIEDQFQLTVGRGILIERGIHGVLYKAESSGQLFFDEGIRLRLETKVRDAEDGIRADIEIGKESFSGQKFNAKDLLIMAKEAGVNFGFIKPEVVQKQINEIKKWPARITVARGKNPVDGKAGVIRYAYREAQASRTVDIERAKLGIVFPDEVIAEIEPPSPPEEGMTVFGEKLRGRPFNELAIYPGRNVRTEKGENKDLLKSTIYGKVVVDQDRIHVENILQISSDAMSVTLDLFPQKLLSARDLISLFRDKDVLAGYDEKNLELKLNQIHKSGRREKECLVAQGKPVTSGKNAKLRYYFNPEDLVEKGLLVKSKTREYYAAPGDLLMVKFEPVEAEPGANVFRERIEVAQKQKSVDIKIEAGRQIIEKEMGTYGSEDDPLRVEYRAAIFGYLRWKNKSIDIQPKIEIDEKEEFVRLLIKAKSDFATPIQYEMIQKYADEEGVRVDLERMEINKALKRSKLESNEEMWVEIAKAIPAVHGEDAKVSYNIKYNNEDMNTLLEKDEVPEPMVLDCVRRKEILAIKTPAGNGQDGKSVFGRRFLAERGLDLPWQIGRGVGRSDDGNSIYNDLDSAGYVFVEDKRIHVVNTCKVSSDKMQATLTLYPSSNPRFQPREDKILAMVQASGVCAGIKTEEIREAIHEVLTKSEKKEMLCAEGVPAQVGREASHRFAIDLDDHSGELREDGSVDYKAGGIFQMVKSGQLLMVKQEATRGSDGFNVYDERLPGQMGRDHSVQPGEGVRLSANELEYYATRDGILEFNGRSLRVIEGLMIGGDVDFSTGNIEAGQARVFVKGGVISDFSVSSEAEIVIEKQAEACQLRSGGDISVNGGIIGKEKAVVEARGKVETLYINSGAKVVAGKDVVAQNEILNSRVFSGGYIQCLQDAGKIMGGELWAYDGIRCKVLGTQASEQETIVQLGVNFVELHAAKQRIEDEGLELKANDIGAHLKKMDADLRSLYEQIPEVAKNDHEEAQRMQETYKSLYEERQEIVGVLETVERQKQVIMNAVRRNLRFEVKIEEMLHPGVVLRFEDTEWKIKEPLKSVIITWDESTKNFVTRRL